MILDCTRAIVKDHDRSEYVLFYEEYITERLRKILVSLPRTLCRTRRAAVNDQAKEVLEAEGRPQQMTYMRD